MDLDNLKDDDARKSKDKIMPDSEIRKSKDGRVVPLPPISPPPMTDDQFANNINFEPGNSLQ